MRRAATIPPADRIGLSRTEAAEYVGLSQGRLLEAEARGDIGRPIRLGGTEVWRRRHLDAYLDRHEEKKPFGVVYFVGYRKVVKIGFTTNLPSRIRSLQNTIPEKLMLYFSFPGKRIDEQRLHAHFAQDRRSGEWFRYSDRIQDWIACQLLPDDEDAT